VRKGRVDVISNGSAGDVLLCAFLPGICFVVFLVAVVVCEEKGSRRRCGGQGDILSGIAALFSFWAAKWEQRWVYLALISSV